jgi:SAM-dependent methyltransferase
MVDWVIEHVPPSSNASILEVGSGNGTLLFGLFDSGYDPLTLHGIDYSPGAVKLSAEIAKSRGGSAITFCECDFLTNDPSTPQNIQRERRNEIEVWNLLLDKGTYDAIALGEKDEKGYSPAVKYPSRVTRLLRPGGYFLITCKSSLSALAARNFNFGIACNFTEDELKASFETEDTDLVYQLVTWFLSCAFHTLMVTQFSNPASDIYVWGEDR